MAKFLWLAVAIAVALAASRPFASAGQATSSMAAPAPVQYFETPDGKKPRVVITADPELDDHNSMIR